MSKRHIGYLEHLKSDVSQNGMVPNAVLVGNKELLAKTQEFLDYVLDHQDESGWLGPEVNTTKPRMLWGRYALTFHLCY